LRWLADENFNNDILRALFRRDPRIDIVLAQDAGLAGKSDPTILEWAASQDRVLLTQEVSGEVSMRTAVEDILLLTECSIPGEWGSQVRYLPLR
jgi:predicted nuclease of predicted toxin-antitoxin system